MQKPADLEYGTVHDIHYRADFGCVEARVRLFSRDAEQDDPGVEILTSVLAIPEEPKATLSTRLVISAARLFRQFELRAAQTPQDATSYEAFAA